MQVSHGTSKDFGTFIATFALFFFDRVLWAPMVDMSKWQFFVGKTFVNKQLARRRLFEQGKLLWSPFFLWMFFVTVGFFLRVAFFFHIEISIYRVPRTIFMDSNVTNLTRPCQPSLWSENTKRMEIGLILVSLFTQGFPAKTSVRILWVLLGAFLGQNSQKFLKDASI